MKSTTTTTPTPERLAELLVDPCASNSVDEDRAIIWERDTRTYTEHEKDVFVALLTLDGPEVIPERRARWLALAAEARATMRPLTSDELAERDRIVATLGPVEW